MDDAVSSAPSTKVIGYDQPGPANMYQDRMSQVFPTDYPILFWLLPLLKPGVHVFDLGGHVGVSFYAYESYINFPKGMTWQVCDVPAVTDAGEALAKEHHKSSLSFTNDVNEMGGSDVLIASGSLQYIEMNLSDMLSALSSPPTHLLINLLPVHIKYSCVTLQNIGTAYCPYRIFKADEFVESLRMSGYKLVDRWENLGKACDIPFHEEYSVKPYFGYYFSRS